MVAEFFVCSECSKHEDQRMYHYGGGNKSMICRRRELCPRMTAIKRQDAVRAVVEKLSELINRDSDLVTAITTRAQEIDGLPDEDLKTKCESLRGRIAVLSNRISDLYEVAGTGTEDDRTETKSRIRAAQIQRSELQAELARLERQLKQDRRLIGPNEVRQILHNFRLLLERAAAGLLGDDLVYRAAYIFKLLVGGRITVYVEQRPRRKRTAVRGRFVPRLLHAVADRLSMSTDGADESAEVEVWLRPPPKCDQLAQRVHELVDGRGLSYGETADCLDSEGHGRMSAVRVSNLCARYYEIIGGARPRHDYNHGRPRKSRPKDK
jgi:hypothetical protein